MFKNNLKLIEPSAATQTFKANNVAKIYKFPPPSNSPVTVSVISFGGGLFGSLSASGVLTGGDVQEYWSFIGISLVNHPKVIVILLNGATNSPVKGQNETSENTMDVSMIGACCPTSKLTIILFITPNSLAEFPNLITKAISPTTIDGVVYNPSVVSMSWGAAEIYYGADLLASINTVLADAAAKGINICASTGDYGSSDGVAGGSDNVDFPASSPSVTACGGTNLICPTLDYSDSTTVEIAWSMGGGGISANFAKPTWQTQASGLKRSIPDISLVADPTTGVEFIISGTNYVFGGTSIVSPAMAAYYACINVKIFLLPLLYAASLSAPTSFHDIKVGSNGSFNASTGFDLCTGLGSIAGDILALNLVQNTVSVSGILIDYSSINLVAGKQIRVTAQIIPPNATNKGVSWSSSNSLVATVRKTACPLVRPNYNPDCDDSIDRYTDSCFEDFTPDCDDRYYDFGNVIDQDILQNPTLACDSIGLITAFVSGTTTITAKSDDGMFTASTTVTVTGVIVKVTGVTLNTAFLSLNVGDVNQLQATVSPQNATNKSVTWSASSNIITISNTGLVKAISTGSVSVIVKTVDGGFTARTLVTITQSTITSIRFSPSSIYLFTYTTYQSNLLFFPNNVARTKVTYSSTLPNIATVDAKGFIIAYSPGSVTIRATMGSLFALLQITVIDILQYYGARPNSVSVKPRRSFNSLINNNSLITMRR